MAVPVRAKYDILLKNCLIVDPQNHTEKLADIGISNGRIEAVADCLNAAQSDSVFDVKEKYVIPGIVDLHMHASQWLGGIYSHKMLAMAGVTSAVDMSGPIDSVLQIARDYGCGLTIACVDHLRPGYNIENDNPSQKVLQKALNCGMEKGAIGFKILAGNYPLTPQATAEAIQVANDSKAYVAFHAATSQVGSNIEGFHEAIKLAGTNKLHLAHINSYCRGLIRPCISETEEAITSLIAHPNIRTEAYLSPFNGNNGKCKNGIPEASVIRNCLKTGGYAPTEKGLEQAILEGWAQIHMTEGGQTILRTGYEAAEYWKKCKTDTGVSFLVNPPEPRYRLAAAKRPDGTFVIDAISTDGGGIPRNVILSMGLSLVKLKALTMAEFVQKVSVNPCRILGMHTKGHLSEGADADITVIDYEKQCAYMSIASGNVVMYKGMLCGKGSRILTTSMGTDYVQKQGLTPILTDLASSAFYKGFTTEHNGVQ